MNEETTDFFTSLNKLTSLPHHSSFHSYPKKSEASKIEEIPSSITSNQICSNTSSGVYSSCATIESRLEIASPSSSDQLFIPNTNLNKNEKDVAQNGDDYDDTGLETIELINETKKSLLIEVSLIKISKILHFNFIYCKALKGECSIIAYP